MIWNWIIAAVTVAVSYSAHKKAKQAQRDAEDAAKGLLINKNSNIDFIPVVYGTRRVGGTRVFISTKDVSGGDENEYLYIALVVSEGEVESITNLKFDDIDASDPRFNDLIDYNVHLGTDTQAADSLLQEAPDWTSSHQLKGVAYIALRLKYDQDAWNGIPNITAVVQGRKLYDPRTQQTVFSNNPALCLYDYLTNTRYGKGLLPSVIDLPAFNTAANECDQFEVTPYSGGSDIKIFQCNYVVKPEEKIIDNVRDILASCRGFLPFSNGKYSLKIDSASSSVKTFNTDNIIGGINIKGGDKSTTQNRNMVKFANADIDYQPDQAAYPDPGSTEDTTYLEENNDERLQETVELKACTDYYIARDFARIITERSRNHLRVTFQTDSSGLELNIADVITVNHPTPDWGDKLFQVEEITLNADMTANILAVEYDPSIYAYDESAVQKTYPDTNLPNPFSVSPPTNLTSTNSTSVSGDGSVIPSLTFNWTAPDDSFVQKYEFQYKRESSTLDHGFVTDSHTENPDYGLITDNAGVTVDYGNVTDAATQGESVYTSVIVNSTQFVITGTVPDVNYNVRVRAINDLGVRSSFVDLSALVAGDTTPPSIPNSVAAAGGLKEITITWERPVEHDYSHVEVWEGIIGSSAAASRIAIASGDSYTRTGLDYDVTRYYHLKSVDFSGNVSDFSSTVSATTLFVDSDAFSDSVNNLFAEAGAYGIEPVSSLPASGDFVGQIKYDTTANALYRWTGSAWSDDIFSIEEASVTAASFASGIEPVSIVSSLPSPTGYTGPLVLFLTTDEKLYRYDSSVPEFTTAVPTVDLVGEVAEVNFSEDLMPPKVVSTLPTAAEDLWQGRQVFLTTDNKLYRYNGTEWTASVSTTDLSGQVSGPQIEDGAINNARIAVDAIQGDVIAASAIDGDKIADDAISAAKIADQAVETANLALEAVTDDIIAAGAITAVKIADAAVETDKIADTAITAAKIGDAAVETAKLALNAVTEDIINAGSITEDKLATNAVSETKLATGAVTEDIIAANSITELKIADTAVTVNKISDGAINAAKIADEAVSEAKLAVDAVTENIIAAGAITETKIADDSITTAKIDAGAVTTAKIDAGAITANEISTDAVTADKILASSVTTAKLDAGAITAEKLAVDSVTSDKIEADAITSNKIATGTITSQNIGTGEIKSNNIQTGSISTLKLAAGAVTASKMVLSGQGSALNDDPLFTDIDAWVALYSQTTDHELISLTTPNVGSTAVRNKNGKKAFIQNLNPIKVDRNKVYRLHAQVKKSINANGRFNINITQWDVNNNIVQNFTTSFLSNETLDNTDWNTYNFEIGGDSNAQFDEDTAYVHLGAALNTRTSQDLTDGNGYVGFYLLQDYRLEEKSGGSLIVDGSITANKIASEAVTADKVDAGAITTAKLDAGAVTTAKLNSGAVTTDILNTGAVTAIKIDSGAVTTAKLDAGAVTTAKLDALAVTADKIDANAITADKIDTDAVTADAIAANSITSLEIDAGTIAAANIATDAIEAYHVKAGNITGTHIFAGSVSTEQLSSEAVTTAKLDAGAVTAGKIDAGAVTTAKLDAGAVTSAKIQAGAVDTEQLNAGAITTEKIDANAITASKMVLAGSGSCLNDDPLFKDSASWNGGAAFIDDLTLAGDLEPGEGAVGNNGIRNATGQQSVVVSVDLIPVDFNKTYRVRCMCAESTNNTARLYVGVDLRDENGAKISGDGSYWSYDGASGVKNTDHTWIEYSAQFGAGTANDFPSNAKTMRPLLILSHISASDTANGITRAGHWYAQDLRIEEAMPASLIVDGAIDADKIAANSVTTEKIESGAITTDRLDAGAVTAAKLAVNSVTADAIEAGTITSNKIASNTITADQIAGNTITGDQIAGNTITADQMAANSIESGSLATGAVTADAIDSGIITSDHIAAGTIQASNIGANQITAGLIAASGVITSAAQIDDGIITNAKIKNASIETGKIKDAQITGAKIKNLEVDTLKIGDNAVTVPVSKIQSTHTRQKKNNWSSCSFNTFSVGGYSYKTPRQGSTSIAFDFPAITVNLDAANRPVQLDFNAKYQIAHRAYTSKGSSVSQGIYAQIIRGTTVLKGSMIPSNGGISGFHNSSDASNALYNSTANTLNRATSMIDYLYVDTGAPSGNNTYKLRLYLLLSGTPASMSRLTFGYKDVVFRALELKK